MARSESLCQAIRLPRHAKRRVTGRSVGLGLPLFFGQPLGWCRCDSVCALSRPDNGKCYQPSVTSRETQTNRHRGSRSRHWPRRLRQMWSGCVDRGGGGGCLLLSHTRLRRRARPHGARLCRTCAAQGFKRSTEPLGQPAAKPPPLDTSSATLSAPPGGPASRDAVLAAATQTAVGLAGGGLAARAALHAAHQAGVGPLLDPSAVLPLLTLPWDETRAVSAGGAVLMALGVTGLRGALLAVWPSFRESTESANAQVLPNLSPLDIAYVAAVSAVSEARCKGGWRGLVRSADTTFAPFHRSCCSDARCCPPSAMTPPRWSSPAPSLAPSTSPAGGMRPTRPGPLVLGASTAHWRWPPTTGRPPCLPTP